MTTIAILGGDFEILFDDETVGANAVAGLRTIRRASGASATVYTTLQLYSAVADAADEFQAMGFRNPMLPVTPNAFTLENSYFMPRSSTEWLKEGTITADWSTSASPDSNGNGVIAVGYTGGTDFVSGDIGRQVTQAGTGDTGTLLDFETDIDGNQYAWIRPDDSTPTTGDTFDGTGALSVTGDGGTGASTSSTAGVTGITRYTAIQAIGAVPSATEVYIYQNRTKLTDSTGGFQWWVTDPNVSLGIISVLVRTHFQAATTGATDGIADSDLEVFARRYTSLYDNFRLNVAAGGFSALPLASSPDINNTTGYRTASWNTGTGTAMQVGDVLTNTSVTGASYVVTAVTDSGATGTFEYYPVGNLTDFVDTNTFTSPNRNGTINGAPTNTTGGPTDTGTAEGGTVTIALGATTSDEDGSGTAEPYSVTIDAQGPGANGVPIAKVYERIKYVCRRGAPNTDLFGAGVNVPGESYRGLEALVYYDSPVGTLTEGDDLVTDPAGQWTSRLIADRTTTTAEGVLQRYITVTDQQSSLGALANNDVIDDETGDSVTVDTAGAGGSILSITSPKNSPFGTFTGSQIFGAQGILFTGKNDSDTQAYIHTDDLGTLREPPNTVTFLVDNTASGDRVLVARDTGTSGVIDKDQFGGMTVTTASATSITVGGSIDSEVPQAAWIRVVAVDEQQEHRYKYDSRTTGASGVFTLTPISPGTATAGTSSTQLDDSTATFITDGVEIGMLVQDTTNTGTYEVTAVNSETQLAIRHLYNADLIASGDAYTINETIQAYDTNDDLFDLILDVEATGTSTSNTFVQSTLFGTVVNVRQGKIILPFTQNANVGSTGASVTVVRQPDTIAV